MRSNEKLALTALTETDRFAYSNTTGAAWIAHDLPLEAESVEDFFGADFTMEVMDELLSSGAWRNRVIYATMIVDDSGICLDVCGTEDLALTLESDAATAMKIAQTIIDRVNKTFAQNMTEIGSLFNAKAAFLG